MNPQPLLPIFASSQDPTQVSARVTGVIVGASAIIIAFAGSFLHITLTANDVVSLGSGLGLVAGAIVFLVGVVRAIIHKFGKAK